MTVSELISVLQEFDGTELVCTAMAPGDRKDIRVANGEVYSTRIFADEVDQMGLEPGAYTVVVIEW